MKAGQYSLRHGLRRDTSLKEGGKGRVACLKQPNKLEFNLAE